MRQITFFMYILILLFSCKKDPPPAQEPPCHGLMCPGRCLGTTVTKHPLSDSIKPYLFKTSSYWVFENDSTLSLDSLAITNAVRKYNTVPYSWGQCPTDAVEVYIMYIKSFTFSTTYDDFIYANCMKRNAAASYVSEQGQAIFFNNRKPGYTYDGAIIADTMPFMAVGGNTFKNVIKMKIVPTGYYPQFKDTTYLYYCDSIGAIKKVIGLDSNKVESWSLKRWKIML